MLMDEIENKIQLKKVKSTQVNLLNMSHETMIIPYKTNQNKL